MAKNCEDLIKLFEKNMELAMPNRKNSLGILIGVLSLCFMGDAHAAYNQNSNYTSSRTTDTSLVSDQDLNKKINDKIGPGWFSRGYEQVVVQVNNGMVTLQGTVKTLEDKDKVEKKVREIDGVRGVNNLIVIQNARIGDRNEKSY